MVVEDPQWQAGGESEREQTAAWNVLTSARRDKRVAARAFGVERPAMDWQADADNEVDGEIGSLVRVIMPWPGTMAATVPQDGYF